MKALIPVLFFALILSTSAHIINIPDVYPTIQRGIDSSSDGDTVLVQPGVYLENINFNGRNIMVSSLLLISGDSSYIFSTSIDGASLNPTVMFENGESREAVLSGFTIKNGLGRGNPPYPPARIVCLNSGPIIKNNLITQNTNWDLASGIYCLESSPLIHSNIIKENPGGGIICALGEPVLLNNFIFDNIISDSLGVIAYGGGIALACQEGRVENNTVCGNKAQYGGGICLPAEFYITLINNIFWNNEAYIDGNQIYAYTMTCSTSYCDIEGGYTGEGNIDSDPLFIDPLNGDFNLQAGSPCIDAGSPDSPLDPDSSRADIGAVYFNHLVDINEAITRVPTGFTLSPNYPNPFNASTTISYTLPKQSQATLDIYDILGRKVQTLYDGKQTSGEHSVIWNAEGFASGNYLYKLTAGEYEESSKMMLVK